MSFVLSLDEGTTSARAALYDETGRNIAMQSAPVDCRYPQPGWVEQDADEIWNAQLYAARLLLDRAGATAAQIVAAGITNQRETTVVWERASGRPVAPAIVWQCRRTAAYCAELAQSSAAADITRRTGLVIDAYFSGSKIRWILENVPGATAKARDGELLFGNVDTWLIWKLTNGAAHVTDRHQRIAHHAHEPRVGRLGRRTAAHPRRARAPCCRASCLRAQWSGSVHAEHFGAEIPIAGIAGDQQAALAGQACFRAGLSKNTYGTGCFALMHTGGTSSGVAESPAGDARRVHRRSAAIRHRRQRLRGRSGRAVAARQAGLDPNRRRIRTHGRASVPDTGGVYLVPAFVGLGAPYWDADARGILCGLTRSSDRAHIVRATLESIAYQTRELIDAMQADAGGRILELRVDGGAAANNFLMQFQADILGCPIVRPADIETTALGAAYLAGLATGFWKNVGEVESFWRAERRFEPAWTRLLATGCSPDGKMRWRAAGEPAGRCDNRIVGKMKRIRIAAAFIFALAWTSPLPAQTAQTILFRAVTSPPPTTSGADSGTTDLLLHVVEDASGTVLSGSVDFDLAYQFPQDETVTGLGIANAGGGAAFLLSTNISTASPVLAAAGSGRISSQVQVMPGDTAGLAVLSGLLANPGQYAITVATADQPAGAISATLQLAQTVVLMAVVNSSAGTGAASVIVSYTGVAYAITSAEVSMQLTYQFPAQVTFSGMRIYAGQGEGGQIAVAANIMPGTLSAAGGAGVLAIPATQIDMHNAQMVQAVQNVLLGPPGFSVGVDTVENPSAPLTGQLRETDFITFQVPDFAGSGAASEIGLHTLRQASGAVLAGTVVFDVNYRLAAGAQITGIDIDGNVPAPAVSTDPSGSGNAYAVTTVDAGACGDAQWYGGRSGRAPDGCGRGRHDECTAGGRQWCSAGGGRGHSDRRSEEPVYLRARRVGRNLRDEPGGGHWGFKRLAGWIAAQSAEWSVCDFGRARRAPPVRISVPGGCAVAVRRSHRFAAADPQQRQWPRRAGYAERGRGGARTV